MKISDLYEDGKSEEYNTTLDQEIMDILVLYNASGVAKTNIENVINELKKKDIAVELDELKDVIKQLGYTVTDGDIEFEAASDNPMDDLEQGEEYDPVSDMAKDATNKRVK